MSVIVDIYSDAGQVILPAPAQRLRFSTSRRGCAAASFFIPASLADSFAIYNAGGLLRVVVSANGRVIWRGRAEDIAIEDGGVMMGAIGYSSAFEDVLYTALWSQTGTAGFRQVDDDTLSNRDPAQFKMDNNNRVYVGLEKNAVYANADVGEMAYYWPHNSQREITNVSFDYEMLVASGWTARLVAFDEGGASAATEWSNAASGVLQTGTGSVTLSGSKQAVSFGLHNTSGGNITYSGESGAQYLKITNVRIKTTTAATVLASAIAEALVTYVGSINSGQIAGSLITATTTDLQDELYEDVAPAEILDDLAARHGFVWGVDAEGYFYWHARETVGRTWYVDAATLTVERSVNALTNSIYATYRDANGRTLRTAASANSLSAVNYGLVRQKSIGTRTSSSSEAEAHRDAELELAGMYAARMTIEFDRLLDLTGQPWALWNAQAGDTITIRNLPVNATTDIDNLTTFQIARTTYDAERDVLRVEPDTTTPTLVTLVGGQK